MLLKRKVYFIMIGSVLAQLSIASVASIAKQFGDCATCAASKNITFPLDDSSSKLTDVVGNINAKLSLHGVSGFVNGNAVNTYVPNVSTLGTNANTAATAQANALAAQATAPLLPQQQISNSNTIFPGAWMQQFYPTQYYQNYATPYSVFSPSLWVR